MSSNPIPQGNYVPATRFGNIIYTAGMTPRDNGILILQGKVSAETPLGEYRLAVRKATQNAMIAAQNLLADNEKIEKILTITVFINAEDGYTYHTKIADFASEYLCEKLGNDGIGSRAAVGVASLPGNAPVEIQLIVAAKAV